MRRVHYRVRSFILKFIDFFYPLFKRVMTLQMYRYAACGGSNTALNIFIYFISFHYVLHEKTLSFGFYAFEAPTAAYLIAFCITFPIGFYLSMFVVFQGSYLRRRVQLIRYILVVAGCMLITWLLLKVFVNYLGFYPTPSYMITTGFVIFFSYLSQRHFSFKGHPQAIKRS